MSANQVLDKLQASVNGLNSEEAKKRQAIYGLNEIKKEKEKSPIIIFAKQFSNPLILILFAATVVSIVIGEIFDALIIIVIAFLTIFVGFVQEFRSEKAIAALKGMASAKVHVMRNGQEKILDEKELVPGDVILVSVGDRVQADSYLLESSNLETNESSVTGESTPVKKEITCIPEKTPIADRKNILYMITTVTSGRAKAVVFATGMNTELGGIARVIRKVDTGKSPFEIRMRQLGKILSIAMLSVAGIISLIGILRGNDILEMLIWGISLAVAAVPEALPAVVAASLTVGVYRLAKKHAIVRRLPAVETLGSATVICSDKTGTLTKGEMTVRKIFLWNKRATVSGSGYDSVGNVQGIEKTDRDLILLARTCALCNDAKVIVPNNNNSVSIIGDPTEASLLALSSKIGFEKEVLEKQFPRIEEIQFTSERKRMTTVNKVGERYFSFMKGATEIILDRCNSIRIDNQIGTISEETRSKILKENNLMAENGLRVLACAYKELQEENFEEDYVEQGLCFIGLVGMMDPPRDEAIDAIKQCKRAGIDVIMITGDHQLTAEAIAKEMGITQKPFSMTGLDLEEIDVKELEQRLDKVKIFARVSPEHKIKIIHALKNKGHVVAMTGDGINDAAALREADIGIAMGIAGTQVTKEASSIILADDNFASIVLAVRGGRRIMDNVKKYLIYLLPSNIGEIVLFTSAVVMGLPLPLMAKHILYVNLATDGSPAIALGMEPEEPDVMKRKPRNPKESIFANTLRWFIGISMIIGVLSVSIFWYVLEINDWSEYGISKARTILFAFLVFEQLFFALSCRSLTHNLTSIGFFKNKFLAYSLIGESLLVVLIMNHPYLMDVFDLVAITPLDWIMLLTLSTATFVYAEILKMVIRKQKVKAVVP